jgi:NitT/TauT family transport system ATP-binding protein
MTAISLKDVSHTFETRGTRLRALEGIDLEIGENEFVTLVGRSGCGKSTLLRLMAGLLRPTAREGDIRGQALASTRRGVSLR